MIKNNTKLFIVPENEPPVIISSPDQGKRIQLIDPFGDTLLLTIESPAAAYLLWQKIADWILMVTSARMEAHEMAMKYQSYVGDDPGEPPF